MRRLFYKLLSFLLFAPSLVLAVPTSALETPPAGTLETPSDGSALTNPLASNTISEVLDNIIDFLLRLAVPIAVIMTVYVAYLFITAGDNAEKVKSARKTLLWIVVGVMILIISKGVAVFTKSLLAPLGG